MATAKMRPARKPLSLCVLAACVGAVPAMAVADYASTGLFNGATPQGSGFAGEGPSNNWRIEPTLGVGLTWSDNVRLSNEGKHVADWSLRVEPGFATSGRTSRSYGSFRASVNANVYASEDSLNRTNLNMYGTGTVDLYERKLLLDASATASQEQITTLGAPAGGAAYNPNNATQLTTFSLSPYFRWQWGARENGEIRYRATLSDSSNNFLNNSLRQDVSLVVGNGASPDPLGWFLTGNHSVIKYDTANDSKTSDARLYGIYAIDPMFKLRADVGYERNNFAAFGGEEQQIYGGGFEWTPSPRTRFAGMTEKRFFGNGYNYEFTWRGALSSFSATFVRDVTTTSSTLSSLQLLGLMVAYAEAGSKSPDGGKSAAKTWHDRGLPYLEEILAGATFVTRSYYLEKRAQVSGGLTGARNGLALSLTYTDRRRLVDPALLVPGDQLANFDVVEDMGGTLVFNHRLTPVSNLTALLGASRSNGETLGLTTTTRRRDASLSGSTSFGQSIIGSVSYRYQASRGASSYDENSVAATLGMRF
ncbi:TIGR03016 family PEP-CTERM system-associated outer membrane protein [Niveibacterium sp.]|uniref:TIGR03016 family PEP-CTERM system-associated outer membrane protein n=1 Tax=Niveibacterium sp. TaxID=2017444 RepID=UPI0035B31B16